MPPNGVIFQSLYADPEFRSLKHALFYFGKLLIPRRDFLFAWGEKQQFDQFRHVLLAPEHALKHLEVLEAQGVVEFEKEQSAHDDSKELFQGIAQQVANSGGIYGYRPSDVGPLLSFLELDPYHRGTPSLLANASVGLATYSLEGVAKGRGFPCVDNAVLFDLMNIGLQLIFKSSLEQGEFTREEADQLKAQYLGMGLMPLFLPSFEFRSFDDVFELRAKMKGSLARFQAGVLDVSREIKLLPWEPGFQEDLARIFRKRIRPEVEELRKATRVAPGRVARHIAVAGVVMTLQSLLPELVAQWLIGASSVSLVEAVRRERDRAEGARLESAWSLLLEMAD